MSCQKSEDAKAIERKRNNQAAKKYRHKNIEENRRKQREWARANREKMKLYPSRSRTAKRNTMLKKKYSITVSDYNVMKEQQNNRCAICGIHELETKKQRALSVDHSHDNGSIRGLLCVKCNSWLGPYENEEFRSRVRAYLLESE